MWYHLSTTRLRRSSVDRERRRVSVMWESTIREIFDQQNLWWNHRVCPAEMSTTPTHGGESCSGDVTEHFNTDRCPGMKRQVGIQVCFSVFVYVCVSPFLVSSVCVIASPFRIVSKRFRPCVLFTLLSDYDIRLCMTHSWRWLVVVVIMQCVVRWWSAHLHLQ